MPRPDPRTIATRESRSNGGKAKAEKERARRDAEQRALEEALSEAGREAVNRLVRATYNDDDPASVRAAIHVLDRVLGRVVQRTEISGSIDFDAEYRSRLAAIVADQASRSRANGDSQ